MATLEKIRSKSVFLIVVIGVALLAFIIGDALTNSRNIFGDQTTVAKIGNAKIDYTEYQRKREELNTQLEQMRRTNPEQAANFDTQLLPQLALDQLVQETLLGNAADKAGIRTTGNILRYYMLENPQSQEVNDIVRQLQASGMAVQTPQQAYEVIFNPKRNGLTDAQAEPFQRAWLAAEKKMEHQAAMITYQRLLAGTIKANNLDKKALFNDQVTTSKVAVAFHPYGQLDAKAYPVSDAEIQKAYDADKELFALEEPTREVSFIAVSIAPSQADKKAADALAARTVKVLSKAGAALPKDIKKEGVSMSRHSLRAADISNPAVKAFVTSAAGDSARLVANNLNGFTVIRPVSRMERVDSIQLNVVATATDALGKRVLAALNGGLSVDSITNRFSMDSVAPQLNQWIPLYTADGATNALTDAQLDTLRAAGGKFVALMSGPQGATLAQIVKQNAPVAIYEYDEANFVLGPSLKTLNDARTKLEKFLASNTTADKLAKNAAKAGYNVQNFHLTSSDPAVPRFQGYNQFYPESRQVMRWVMIDAKEGEVSHIYEAKSATTPAFYVAAVNGIYEDYVPVTNKDVKEQLTQKIRRQKAGEKLMAQYKAKAGSMQSVAGAMGSQVQTVDKFRFSHNPGVNDPSVTGKICGTKAGKVVLARGEDGVYAYQVLGQAKESIPYNEQMAEQQYYQFVNPDLLGMLKGDNKLKNNIYKFEAGE